MHVIDVHLRTVEVSVGQADAGLIDERNDVVTAVGALVAVLALFAAVVRVAPQARGCGTERGIGLRGEGLLVQALCLE